MSKRVFLNLEQRIEVLRQYENGKSARKSSELGVYSGTPGWVGRRHFFRTLTTGKVTLLPMLSKYSARAGGTRIEPLFNCGRTQINKAIKAKDLILKEYEDFKFRGVKRMRHKKYVDINEAVLEWFKTVWAKKIPVSGPMIQHKAKELADPLGIENFSISNLWLDRFRIWNNITCRSLCGEAADVDPSS
ncbi:hypothetical protein AVEN_2864-1 [Araneus ventricosus]|uniref:HTH CENPB-type domain-containing protein n=1 Tax=Araneus ventricosus TaxID=182803 RepID=A0A4Y2W3Y4_ARAVE|nr:hypothetical protein AVEN_2864-1 [Araneus ventricosus]